MNTVETLRAEAAERGVTLIAVGPYRHFHDNYHQVHRDISFSLPISALIILALLWSLFRKKRDIFNLHLPAIAGVVGGGAAVALVHGNEVPLAAFGFAAGLLGIAVDYGIHMTRAVRDGRAQSVARPLLLSYATTTGAFIGLLGSSVPALRVLATCTIGGLSAAMATAVFILPRLLRRRQHRDPWHRLSDPLVAWSDRPAWQGLALAALLTAALAPGLRQLHVADDPVALSVSSPTTRAEELAVTERWGALHAEHFLVAENPALSTALAAIQRRRQALALPPSSLELLLPSSAEQRRRLAAWNDLWDEHGDRFAMVLGESCATVGLLADHFAPSLTAYQRHTCPPVGNHTWLGTVAGRALSELIERRDEAWIAFSPLSTEQAQSIPMAEPDDDDSQAWAVGPRILGQALIRAMHHELIQQSALVMLATILALAIILRQRRRVLLHTIAPTLALTWTFGTLGHLGMALNPIHTVVIAVTAGIGIDSALFLARNETRRHAMSSILAALPACV
jgi:predicted exporter